MLAGSSSKYGLYILFSGLFLDASHEPNEWVSERHVVGPWQHHDELNQSSVAAATPHHLPCSLLHIPAQRGSVFRKVCSLEYGSKLSWGWLMHFSQTLLGELISTNVALSPESLLNALKVGLLFTSLLLQKCCYGLVNIWPYFKSMLLFLPQIFDSIHSDGLCCHLQRVCCHLGSLLLAFRAKADYLKPVCCTLHVHVLCWMLWTANSCLGLEAPSSPGLRPTGRPAHLSRFSEQC